MYFSSRSKFNIILALIVIFSACLALLISSRQAARATGTSLKISAKSGVASIYSGVSCGVWSVISSPNVGMSDNHLSAVAAVSGHNVWAVGNSQNNQSLQTLIEHWNGASWSIVASPNPSTYLSSLDGVAAISANNVWAVGYYFTSSSSSPQTLIEHWDGTSWSIVSSPNAGIYNILLGVARVPGTTQLWAVGEYYNSLTNNVQQTLVEQWNGSNWSVVSSPNVGLYGNILSGVTAVSASDGWAVGSYYNSSSSSPQTLIEHWDGTSWSVVSSPNAQGMNTLAGVIRVPSSKQLWAVGNNISNSGSSQTLIEQWKASRWNVVSSPNGASYSNTLDGVAAISASNVWAVGYYSNTNGPNQTLIEHWDGTSWSVVSSPNPGSDSDILLGVARVPSTSELWAVGFYFNSGNNVQTLIMFYC